MPTFYFSALGHTVNTLSLRQLATTPQSHFGQVFGHLSGGLRSRQQTDVHKITSGGVLTAIGSNVAVTNLIFAEEAVQGYDTRSWACPSTALNLTDALRITEKIEFLDMYSETIVGSVHTSFLTAQLQATTLANTTWSFTRYLRRSFSFTEGTSIHVFDFGTSTRNSRIDNIDYSAPPANQAPAAPTFTSPAHAAGYTLNRRPQFKVTVSDPNNNAITSIELQVASDTGFTSGVQTFTFNGSWSSGSTVTLTPTSDITLGARHCRARAYDGSLWGNYTTARTIIIQGDTVFWSFPTINIQADSIEFKESWLVEGRIAVNAARQFRGLSPTTSWTPYLGEAPRKGQIDELRNSLQGVLTTVGITATWTDSTINAWNGTTGTQRKGQHWIDIRTYLKQT